MTSRLTKNCIKKSCKDCPILPAFVLLVEHYNASLNKKTESAK